MKIFAGWKQRAAELQKEIYAIYLAAKDPAVPWYAKVLAACVVAYAFSPIDLIPDPIPILGYLDDLILVPLGIYLVLKMIPNEVMAECREKAAKTMSQNRPRNWIAAGIIIGIWIILAVLAVLWILNLLNPGASSSDHR